jgi:putative ABC transport system ATP-binding protein
LASRQPRPARKAGSASFTPALLACYKINSDMPQMIETIDLRKTYHVGKVEVPALRGISFRVDKGEFVSIVGPSGSGKSTLFYVLGGLTRADSGKVLIDQVNFTELSDAARTRMRKSRIGFVFQKFNLLPTLDARSNIQVAVDIAGKNGERDTAYFERIVDLLGLKPRLRHRPAELSGGEQQRVALARALVNRPAIVLADEPTGNLDSKNSEIVLGMLRQSNKELGQTVLMITHNPEAASYADRIVHMRDGTIVEPEQDPQWHTRL